MFEDQSVFLLAAERIRGHTLPFIDFFDLIQKPPGVLITALLATFFSSDAFTLTLITGGFTALCHVANSLLLRAVVKQVCGNPTIASLSAIFFFASFIGLTTSQSLLAEPYFLLCGLGAVWLLERGKNPWLCGLPIMMSFLFRPTAIVLVLAVVALSAQKGRGFIIRLAIPSLLMLSAGILCVYHLGALDKVYRSVVSFNLYHPLASASLLSRAISLARYFFAEISVTILLLALRRKEALSSVRKVFVIFQNQKFIALTVFLSSELVLLLSNRSFFDHYTYELLPGTAVILAIGTSTVTSPRRIGIVLVYISLSILLVLDRVELGGTKILRCVGPDKISRLVTDIPYLVLVRGKAK